MKLLTILTVVAFASTTAFAAEKGIKGQKGGHVLELDTQNAEFVIAKDHTVTVAFYDKAMKPAPVANQTVTATADAPSGKEKLEFEKKGDVLSSKGALPQGDGYNIVVQVRASADAKPKNFRIPMNLTPCAKCKLGEYACVCDE
jgi:hypothetical protein